MTAHIPIGIATATRRPAPEGYGLAQPCLIVADRHLSKTTGYGVTTAARFGKSISGLHVISWVDANGRLPSPEAPCILHRCDMRPCVEPTHLYEGTKKDNAHDTISRGRYVSWHGAKTHCANGHQYDDVNTLILPTGYRECRRCNREKMAARRAAAGGLSGSHNARKTHCPQGHPYSGENLYIQPSNGGRICRTCMKTLKDAYHARVKAQRQTARSA